MVTTTGFAANLVEDLGPEDVKRVIGVFQIEIVTLGQRLEAAAAQGSPDAFRRAAHAIAGAAGAVGAVELEQVARTMMMLPNEADLARSAVAMMAAVGRAKAGLAAFVAAGCCG